MYVYIAGPLTKGNRTENIHNAIMAANRISDRGHIPFVPHLFELWDIVTPHDYEHWMKLDFAWLTRCDILVRLPGESAGSDREVTYANDLEIPVFYGLEEFMKSPLWTI